MGWGSRENPIVAVAFQMNISRLLMASAALVGVAGSAALAQQAGTPVNSSQSLRLPQNPQVFGQAIPSVVKATAIVNGDVITQSDVDQRLALLAIANDGQIPADEIERLRQQVLRNLIDETLQIQAADAASQARVDMLDAFGPNELRPGQYLWRSVPEAAGPERVERIVVAHGRNDFARA